MTKREKIKFPKLDVNDTEAGAHYLALKRRIVDMANANQALMDSTIDPVKKILAEHDLVWGIWQDPKEHGGVGMLVIKGLHHLENGIDFQIPQDLRISAVVCLEKEQAVAARQVLGDEAPENKPRTN